MEVLDKYRLEESLGEGGMARVWRAVDTSLHRPVVIKIMKLGLDPSERERFLAEARALCKLRSRHLLEVLDFGESGGSFYFVMPFVQVASLADIAGLRKRQERRFEPAEAAALMLQVARALEEAHRNQIVHRDVKPQNILVGFGCVYLTDFGIARDLGTDIDLTQSGTVVGTPRYMAPQQIRGGRVDFSADLYSTGLILFELLVGRLPGELSSDLASLLRNRLDGHREPLAGPRPDAQALAAVVDDLLGHEADRTIRTAQDLVSALAAAAAGAEALAAVQADVETLLGPGDRLPLITTWTTVGQKASALNPRAAPAAEEPRRPVIPPLSRPTPAPARAASRPILAAASSRRPALVGAGAVCLLVVLWLLVARSAPSTTAIANVRALAGFQRVRLEWSGEAKELSLVNPRGQEEIYDVRARQQWDSGTLSDEGTYAASLVPPTGPAVAAPPIQYRPVDVASVPARVGRAPDGVRVSLTLPVPADVEATLRSEGLSVVRASSPSASQQHALALKLDPAESASLQLVCRSLLGEEASGPVLELPSLASSLRAAAAATTEKLSKISWKSVHARLFRAHRNGAGRLAPTALADVAALGLESPFAGLLDAMPGFFDSERVSLEDKNRVYQAIQRAADPYFLLERYGVTALSPVYAALPDSWACSYSPRIARSEEWRLPFDGIMSFKPRVIPIVDFQDEVTRVQDKETELVVRDTASVRQAEILLETWALKPDQIFVVAINDRVELEMRARGADCERQHAAKQTLPLYHPFDPAALSEGGNRFRVSIRLTPGGDLTESAALNSTALLLRRASGASGHASDAVTRAATGTAAQ